MPVSVRDMLRGKSGVYSIGPNDTVYDALRLMAVLLAHWDNKDDNQRLVCLSQIAPTGTRCDEPFLLLQDVGATFGPNKLDLEEWEHAPVWHDRATCMLSMQQLPYHGGTFEPVRVKPA